MAEPNSQILSVAQMRAAEQALIDRGSSVDALMRLAGQGAAEWVWRLAWPRPVTVLCGPGNNGGDGYVIAEALRHRGLDVAVVAPLEPKTEAARNARAGYRGPVHTDADGRHGGTLVDCLFGTGLRRKIAPELIELLAELSSAHDRCVALDVPSGIDADEGTALAGGLPRVDLTLALGALKPAHVLPSAVRNCGEVRVIDLGLEPGLSRTRLLQRPSPPSPTGDSHKYNRGMVGVIAGKMPGAAILAATAAARAGAGYVAVYGDASGGPASLVHRPLNDESLSDERLDVVLVGPGLGRGDEARRIVKRVLEHNLRTVVLDGDALHLFEREWLVRNGPVILTPHYGEYLAIADRLGIEGDPALDVFARKVADAQAMAPSGFPPTVVFKGATTFVVAQDEVRVLPRGNPWLSTAGTGDVLAGAIAAMAAVYFHKGGRAFDAAAAGVWLHSQAAHNLGAAFIADDLAAALSAVRAAL